MSEPGRRSAAGRRSPVSPTFVVGVVLVLLTIGALALVRPHEPTDRSAPPRTTALRTASVGCPTGLPDAGTAAVATAGDRIDGEVSARTGGDEAAVPVRSGEVATVEAAGPVVLTGSDDLAPGLLAARFGADQLAALACPAPAPSTWFTGVGAGALLDSELELVNPDEGPAVVDVEVYGLGGVLDVPELRGITVSGHDGVRLSLAEVIPRRRELALHVVVSRGRLSATLLDEVPELGARPATRDWLSGQAEPTTDAVHLGLAPGRGTDVLALANPGADEARVEVRILTTDSAFAPEGLEEVRVPPGGVRTVTLTTAIRAAVRDDAIGIRVIATEPVTSGLRSVVEDDLVPAAPVLPLGTATTALVPRGSATLLLADADGAGVAVVEAWTADGRALEQQRVELKPGQGGSVELPRGTALVRVTPQRASVHGAVLVTGPGGASVVPLREPVAEARIPDVRPGLP